VFDDADVVTDVALTVFLVECEELVERGRRGVSKVTGCSRGEG
jgi:hypothetical protein